MYIVSGAWTPGRSPLGSGWRLILEAPQVMISHDPQSVIVSRHAETALWRAIQGVLDNRARLAVRAVLGYVVWKPTNMCSFHCTIESGWE